jgi:hypothetical protein
MTLPMLLLACSPVETPTSLDVVVSPSPHLDMAWEVQLSGPPGEAWVEVGRAGDTVTTHEVDVPADGALPVFGLPAGADVPLRVWLRDGDGQLHRSAVQWIRTPEAPAPLDAFELRQVDRRQSEVALGYLVLSTFPADDAVSFAALVDGQGRPVWWAPATDDRRTVRAKLSLDERSLLWAESVPETGSGSPGRLVRQALDGETPPEFTQADLLHHDFIEEPDGGWTWLGRTFGRFGLDPDPPLAPVATDLVMHTAPDGTTTTEFDFFEDFPVQPWWVCNHMAGSRIVDNHHEWTHTNSLIAHPGGDGWWVLPRYLDALVRVDGDGRFAGQLGGRDSTWTLGPGATFSHGHASHAFDDRLLVFDNIARHGDQEVDPSRVVELQLDEASQHAEAVWSVGHPDGGHAGILGDARRLPGGHTLVSWGEDGLLTEHDASGRVVWELTVPAVVARVTFVPDLPDAPVDPVELP